MKQNNLEVFRGDTFEKTLTFTKNGSPLDITGATIIFTVKEDPASVDGDAFLQEIITTHLNPTGGVSEISISAEDIDEIPSGIWKYDIQLTLATAELITVMAGDFIVDQDVTKRRT